MQAFGAAMQSNLENGGSDRKKCHSCPPTAEIGLQLERAGEKIDRKHSAETVADHEEFVEVRAAHRVGELLGEPVKASVQHGIIVMYISAGENPVIEELR